MGGGSSRGGGGGGGKVDIFKTLIAVIVKMQKKKSQGAWGAGVRSGVGSWLGVARLGVVGDVVYWDVNQE